MSENDIIDKNLLINTKNRMINKKDKNNSKNDTRWKWLLRPNLYTERRIK